MIPKEISIGLVVQSIASQIDYRDGSPRDPGVQTIRACSFKGVFITRACSNQRALLKLVILPPSRSLGTPEFWVPSQFILP